MIRTQIYIPDDLHKELKLLGHLEKKNFSILIREGAKLLIEKKKKTNKFDPWQDFIGKGTIGIGPTDLSSNLDYYLYDEPYQKKK